MSDDRWYAAILLVRGEIESDESNEPFTDHSIRLLKARNAESAYQLALALGAEEATSYPNVEGETITWRFIGLEDLCEMVEPPADGSEVMSWLDRRAVVPVEKEQLTVFWSMRNDDELGLDLAD